MQYENVVQGRFLSRPNRFIAVVDIGGTETVCHVKNTGRCRELLVPGAAVWLVPGVTPGRKTPYDLIAVDKGGKLINMDAQAPNRVFGEFARRFDPLAQEVRPEYRFGASRLDFCLTRPDGLHLVEVKGVTLESGGHARFPDAPTERGVKHLHELAQAQQAGYRCAVAFVIQMEGITEVRPNVSTQPEFGTALAEAKAAGVQVLFLLCHVGRDSLEIVEQREG